MPPSVSRTRLIVGCGYLGSRVARRWLDRSDTIYAVTRSARRADEWRALGIIPIVADVTRPQSLNRLPVADTVLYAVGYDRAAQPTMRQVYVEGLASVLDALPTETGRMIYIGSTSVYGQTGGAWIDEESRCEPLGENGRICLAAEERLADHRIAARSVRLRMAGIYGPGRIPRQDAIARGEPINAPGQGYLNLIHVDDAASVVLRVADGAARHGLYLISDGHPVQRSEYYAELARLVGGPPPQFVEAATDSPAWRRAESNKRVDNRRMLADLDIRLRYPTFREGLAAIVRDEPFATRSSD